MSNRHIPVMLRETIEALNLKKGYFVIDCTLGLGGHSLEILKRIGRSGFLLGIDQDEEALSIAREKLKKFSDQILLVRGNFADLDYFISLTNFAEADAILFDLGVSSLQLDKIDRGFSFQKEALLDMRMDRRNKKTAEFIINNYNQKELARIFRDYGQERFANRIAKNIVFQRKEESIKTTLQLAELVKKSVPRKFWPRNKHVATKVFMALRIEVNQELENIKKGIKKAVTYLKKNRRLVVLTFHSLEYRLVKDLLKQLERGCVCDPKLPICQCSRQSLIKFIHKRPMRPSAREVLDNPRARSALLLTVEKI